MRIEIDIPKEFEEHFKQDKFKDSFERIMADIKHSLENGDCLCAGRYEYETIEMLEEALENSKTAYDVDKVVEQLEKAKHEIASEDYCRSINDKEKCDGRDCFECCAEYLIEIVKQGGVYDDDDSCEWRCDAYERWHTKCHILSDNDPLEYTYCPYCGKKIKVVD